MRAGQGGMLGRLHSEQGPSLLGIGWAYSEWIWLPEDQRMPFSRDGVPLTKLGEPLMGFVKCYIEFRFSEIQGRRAKCMIPNQDT